MSTQDIIYQQSPQFLVKTCLYLENLFAFIHESSTHTHPMMHYDALKNLVKILGIIEKPELKSRFCKEFIRLERGLSKTLKIDKPELWDRFLQKSSDLQQQGNRFHCDLEHDSFLQSIKSRQSNQEYHLEPSSTHIYYWLHQDPKSRQHMIKHWLKSLHELHHCVQIYISILRRHAEFQPVEIKDNFIYQAFAHTLATQLLMIKIPYEMKVVPKIQVANHSVNIHFNDPLNIERASAYSYFIIDMAVVKL
ncbi:MAG: cell division protein ZapD [Gammaproteobacteria bacterium]|nr:cell division protein ZapD [Gammaproteobacteria bacterium]